MFLLLSCCSGGSELDFDGDGLTAHSDVDIKLPGASIEPGNLELRDRPPFGVVARHLIKLIADIGAQ